MSNSLIPTMTSNILSDEDEPMQPAGLDMTRGSLQDILDGRDGHTVDVSSTLPPVPADTTNPFTNQVLNQTLGELNPNRDLGTFASFKVTDADLIIKNLNDQLASAVEKNDTSTALLQRMNEHQNLMEAQMEELKAETQRLEEEKNAEVKEKQDYTINQDKLADNIRSDLKKEYADREPNLIIS